MLRLSHAQQAGQHSSSHEPAAPAGTAVTVLQKSWLESRAQSAETREMTSDVTPVTADPHPPAARHQRSCSSGRWRCPDLIHDLIRAPRVRLHPDARGRALIQLKPSRHTLDTVADGAGQRSGNDR